MVFPRNAGFGRCYLVSTRYQILSNIDRNLTGTRLRLRKTEINKCRESANPIPVLLLPFESQTVAFQRFGFHLRKFKKLIIKKFYFHNQTCQHSSDNGLLLEIQRGQLGKHGSTPVSTVFPIFYNKYIFSNKNAFQVEIWKMLDSPCLISTTIWKLTLMR